MNWKDLAQASEGPMRLALVGVPEESDLHQAHKVAAASVGASGQPVALEVADAEFTDCIGHLQQLGFGGVGVAGSHKVSAARLGEKFYMASVAVGVANALLLGPTIYARNTECIAFSRLIAAIPPRKALLMGAGQAARIAALSLLEANWHLNVWNRSFSKSRLICTTFARYGEIETTPVCDPVGCSLVVNATPLGAKPGERPPLVWSSVRPKTTFLDFAWRHVPTEMLREAALRGCQTIDGREVVAEQVAECYEWWLNSTPDRGAIRSVLGIKSGPAAELALGW